MTTTTSLTASQLQTASYPVYIAGTFDGAINGESIRNLGPAAKASSFAKYKEQFFAIPKDAHKQLQERQINQLEKDGTELDAVAACRSLLSSLTTAQLAAVQDVAIIDPYGAYLSDADLLPGEYYGRATRG
jgi:hypothetical protein